MKLIKLSTLGLSVLAIVGTLSATSQAIAATYTSEYVEGINLTSSGQSPVITVKNISANKHVNSIDLKVQETALNFEISGGVECKSANNVAFHGAWAYFGPVGMGGLNNLNTASTVHHDDVSVAFTDKQNKIAEYTVDSFSVPYSKVKNAHPVLRVDAIKEIEAKLQAYVQNGGNAVDFYKKDQTIVLQRPLSLVAMCGKPADNTYGIESKNFTVQIKYQGDAAVNDTPILNAQLKDANPANQYDAGKQDFKLLQATFQPNIPHYSGQCIPEQNPKIRINFKGVGTEKGVVDLLVRDGGLAAGGTNGIIVEPANGEKHWDYELPLIEMMQFGPNKDELLTLNKTTHHELTIKARYRNFTDGTWSEYKDFGTATFNHRCLPQVTVPLGGNGAKYDNGNANKPLQLKPAAGATQAKPLDKVQQPTARPVPRRAIKTE